MPTDPIIADSMMNIRRTEYSRMPSDFMIAMSWRFLVGDGGNDIVGCK